MSDSYSSCLSEEELEQFASGSSATLELSAAERVSHHLAECDSCRSAADAIRRNNAALGNLMPRGLSSLDAILRTAPTPSIPGYRIVGEVHRGGQGVVYEAVQLSTSQRVALKVMREGPLANAHERARFDREVRVLAQLKHPHIVTIHDSGEAGGLNYIVMDYVDGVPLDEYVSEKIEKSKSRKVETEELLRLFAEIAEAVNAAHLIGVIHRDLKPSNILVVDEHAEKSKSREVETAHSHSALRTPHSALPKVLDFGLARLSTDANSIQNLKSKIQNLTMTGQFVGSLPYASPEQAEGAHDKIDIRTDVYSLGVILYRMLTGAFPYDVSGNLPDVLNSIRHTEPARMRASRRVYPGAPPATTTPARHMERGDKPRGSPLLIDGEVETIVLRCLQKDPVRRYQSAGELARDLRHYLAGEPIEARRDSTWYVFRKMLARNRAAALVGIGYVATVTAAAVALAVLYRAQTFQRGRAEESALAAQRSAATAREESDKQKGVTVFLQDLLAMAGPDMRTTNPDITVREALDRAAKKLDDGALSGQPEVEAAVRRSIGNTYSQLSIYDEGLRHLQRSYDLLREKHGGQHPEVAIVMAALGVCHGDRREFPEAEGLLRPALEVLRRDPGAGADATLHAMTNLGGVLRNQRKLDEAEPLLREALAGWQALADKEVEAAGCMQKLGATLISKGQPKDAIPLYERAIEIRRRHAPEGSQGLVEGLGMLAQTIGMQGRMDEAEALLREGVAMSEKLYPEPHAQKAVVIQNLATCLRIQGKLDEAAQLALQLIAIRQAVFGEVHETVADGYQTLGQIQELQGALEDALHNLSTALSQFQKTVGKQHPHTTFCQANVARTLTVMDRGAEAERLLREVVDADRAALGPAHKQVGDDLSSLGSALMIQDRPEEAEPVLREAVAILRATRAPRDTLIAGALHSLSDALLLRGKPSDLEECGELLAEAYSIRQEKQPGRWGTAFTQSLLGGQRAACGQLEEAEELLLEGWDIVSNAAHVPVWARRRVLGLLVDFYTTSNRADQAEIYRASLELLTPPERP